MKKILSIIVLCLLSLSCKADVEFICESESCVDCQGLKPLEYSFKDNNGNEMTNCTRYVCSKDSDNSFSLKLEPIEGASCDIDGDAGDMSGVCRIIKSEMVCVEVPPH